MDTTTAKSASRSVIILIGLLLLVTGLVLILENSLGLWQLLTIPSPSGLRRLVGSQLPLKIAEQVIGLLFAPAMLVSGAALLLRARWAGVMTVFTVLGYFAITVIFSLVWLVSKQEVIQVGFQMHSLLIVIRQFLARIITPLIYPIMALFLVRFADTTDYLASATHRASWWQGVERLFQRLPAMSSPLLCLIGLLVLCETLPGLLSYFSLFRYLAVPDTNSFIHLERYTGIIAIPLGILASIMLILGMAVGRVLGVGTFALLGIRVIFVTIASLIFLGNTHMPGNSIIFVFAGLALTFLKCVGYAVPAYFLLRPPD